MVRIRMLQRNQPAGGAQLFRAIADDYTADVAAAGHNVRILSIIGGSRAPQAEISSTSFRAAG